MNKPQWVRKDAFTIVGVEKYTSDGIASIRQAWDEFLGRSGEIRHAAQPMIAYGYEDYSRDFRQPPDSFPQFHYVAGLETEPGSEPDVPAGMTVKHVPSATYAMFRHEGPLSGIAGVFHYVYKEWLPSSGFDIDPAVMGDFERYPEPVSDPEHAAVEIYIPVVPASDPQRRLVEEVELPEWKAAVIRSECNGYGTREAWAKIREQLSGSPVYENAEEGFVFVPEWQWRTAVRELWTGVKVDSFDGLPDGVERWTVPGGRYARVTVRGGRDRIDAAYGILDDWFAVTGHIRNTEEGSFGFDANRLKPIHPFDVPADEIDWFDYDIYVPILATV
ncbi:effector binding domain-containing protein [Cohnella zeiphila]|uniref:Effector binding domain-containing protein n=1 Tax=Cohnella zeiphila TaxID=2761120 RepID=A0A7X0SLU2_9BACL|nr:effector binding domain-containing protein [Cohnella zeiphila]